MKGLFERFDRLDTTLNRWLVAHSVAILRISLGRPNGSATTYVENCTLSESRENRPRRSRRSRRGLESPTPLQEGLRSSCRDHGSGAGGAS